MANVSNPFHCTKCKSVFASVDGAISHAKQKHKGQGLSDLSNTVIAERKAGHDDESFASRAVNAQLDHAMGVSNPDYEWLVEPFK